MADIFVYSPNCQDFDNLGECGPLTCISAKFIEEANGLSELTLEHPIDEIGRWSYLIEGYILQAEVPVRTTPEIKDGAIVVSTEIWQMKTTATKNERGLYTKASGGKRLKTVPIWDDKAKTKRNTVCVVDIGDTRYKVKLKKGYGWINKSAVEYLLTPDPLDPTPESIELVAPAWSIKPQLFRMHAPEIKNDRVVVKARHISYDLLGNNTTYDPGKNRPDWNNSKEYAVGDVVLYNKHVYFCKTANKNVTPTPGEYWTNNPTCGAALAGIMNRCIKPHDFRAVTNIADQRVITDWTDISPLEALLGLDNGLVTLWGADFIRDNWELAFLDDAGLNRGVRIEYGKNLIGVECSLDTSNLITSIKPIGQTKKGKPLYLAPGTYTVDGKTVVVDNSLTVNSAHESEYPVPHVYTMDLGSAAKAVDTDPDSVGILDAREKMIKACLDKFRQEQCDLPLLTLKVDFISLGSTEEYKQFKELENIYLFDRVTIWHPKIAIDVMTSVKRIEFDPIREQFISIEVGPVRRDATRKKLPSWSLPPALQVAYGSVGPGGLSDEVQDSIDLTNNESVHDVAQTYVRNAWITGEQVFKYLAGSSTPIPSSILLSANIQNVLVDKWQYKNSDGNWIDYPTGDGNLTNNATTLIVKPGHSTWVGDLCTVRLLTNDIAISDIYNLYKVYDGQNGVAYYTWIKYADDASGSGMSDSPTGKTYIGIGSNKTASNESTNPSDYKWSLIKGTDGVPGNPGADGVTYYTWIKYGDDASGSGMSDSPAGKKYIGIAANKVSSTESSNPADYKWALIKGDTGVPGSDGLHGLTPILGNAAHTLPKSTSGVITYTGSGTTLRIFEGAQELSYDGTGLANGSYKVTAVATGITCGSLSDSGAYLTVGNHSNMTTSTASVRFDVTGKRQNGTLFSISITQTLSVAQQGATGESGVVFRLYAPNGSVFSNQNGSLSLQAVGYDGANLITSGATYIWKKYQSGSWQNISGQTGNVLTVSGSDVVGLQAFRCEMTYNGVVYSDTITLTDKTDSFQSGIQSTGGNTFRNGIGKTCLSCRIWQNSQEIDPLKTSVMSEMAPSNPSTGTFWYKINSTTSQIALMRWNGSAWVDVTTNPTYAHEKSYTWYRRDKDGNSISEGAVFATGKVIYADGDDVDQKTTFVCEVS